MDQPTSDPFEDAYRSCLPRINFSFAATGALGAPTLLWKSHGRARYRGDSSGKLAGIKFQTRSVTGSVRQRDINTRPRYRSELNRNEARVSLSRLLP